MRVSIMYFASLKDQTNKSNEVIETKAKTAQELFIELDSKYSFKLSQKDLRVAINEEYQDFSAQINENDTIVFIPPVAGG